MAGRELVAGDALNKGVGRRARVRKRATGVAANGYGKLRMINPLREIEPEIDPLSLMRNPFHARPRSAHCVHARAPVGIGKKPSHLKTQIWSIYDSNTFKCLNSTHRPTPLQLQPCVIPSVLASRPIKDIFHLFAHRYVIRQNWSPRGTSYPRVSTSSTTTCFCKVPPQIQ